MSSNHGRELNSHTSTAFFHLCIFLLNYCVWHSLNSWIQQLGCTIGNSVSKQSRDFPQPCEMRDLSYLHHHRPANVTEDLLGGTRHSLRPTNGSSESPSTSLTQKVEPYSGFVQLTSSESQKWWPTNKQYKPTGIKSSLKSQATSSNTGFSWLTHAVASPRRKNTANCMEKGPQSVLQPLALPDSGQRKLKELKWVTNPQVAHATVARTEIFMSLQRVGNEDSQRTGTTQGKRWNSSLISIGVRTVQKMPLGLPPKMNSNEEELLAVEHY